MSCRRKILEEMHKGAPVTMPALADLLGYSRQNIQYVMADLEHKGVIKPMDKSLRNTPYVIADKRMAAAEMKSAKRYNDRYAAPEPKRDTRFDALLQAWGLLLEPLKRNGGVTC